MGSVAAAITSDLGKGVNLRTELVAGDRKHGADHVSTAVFQSDEVRQPRVAISELGDPSRVSKLSSGNISRFPMSKMDSAVPKPLSFAAVASRKSPASTFASVVARSKVTARLPDLHIPNRSYGVKDGVPAISFSMAEYQAATQQFSFSIVAKFQMGRPSLDAIREFVKRNWLLKGGAVMSPNWDDRHVVIILDSEEDVNSALTCPFRKVENCYFRLFRWSPDCDPKKESTLITKWIRLPGLPMPFFNRSMVRAIVSSFAHFLDIDDRSKALNSLLVCRACVEIDVAQPVPSRVWINFPGAVGFFQDVVVEGSTLYCSKCNMHGHEFRTCKKNNKVAERRPEYSKNAEFQHESLDVTRMNIVQKEVPAGGVAPQEGEWRQARKGRRRNRSRSRHKGIETSQVVSPKPLDPTYGPDMLHMVTKPIPASSSDNINGDKVVSDGSITVISEKDISTTLDGDDRSVQIPNVLGISKLLAGDKDATLAPAQLSIKDQISIASTKGEWNANDPNAPISIRLKSILKRSSSVPPVNRDYVISANNIQPDSGGTMDATSSRVPDE